MWGVTSLESHTCIGRYGRVIVRRRWLRFVTEQTHFLFALRYASRRLKRLPPGAADRRIPGKGTSNTHLCRNASFACGRQKETCTMAPTAKALPRQDVTGCTAPIFRLGHPRRVAGRGEPFGVCGSWIERLSNPYSVVTFVDRQGSDGFMNRYLSDLVSWDRIPDGGHHVCARRESH